MVGGAIEVTEIVRGVALVVPHEVVPVTVRFPDVAPTAKLIVLVFPEPVMVAPVPE
jgi:hypothetical protein